MNKEEILRFHGEQLWGEYPYRVHLENVAFIATAHFKNTDRVRRIAWSHDLLEDTSALPEHVDSDIRDSVKLLSRNYSQGSMTYHEYIRFIAESGDEDAIVGKLSDALVNYALSRRDGNDLIKRYKRSIPVLWLAVTGEPVDWDRVDHIANEVRFQ